MKLIINCLLVAINIGLVEKKSLTKVIVNINITPATKIYTGSSYTIHCGYSEKNGPKIFLLPQEKSISHKIYAKNHVKAEDHEQGWKKETIRNVTYSWIYRKDFSE